MSHIGNAIRQLKRHPGISLVVILMLAVGIGTTTAMFTLFHQVLIRPLPVPEPNRLVNIVRTVGGQGFSYPMLRDFEAEQSAFSGIAAHWPFATNVAYGENAVSLQASYVSGGYFAVLGLVPSLGRLIGPQDVSAAGESAVVVLSHGFWQSRLGGDSGIVGRTLSINGHSLTVIGVAPKGFSGTQLGGRSELYVPLTMRWRMELNPLDTRSSPDSRNFTWLRLFARLGDGTTIGQAAANLNTVHGRILREIEAPTRGVAEDSLPEFLRARLELLPGNRGQGAIPDAAESLPLLLGVTALVLLVVCVNVVNLLLVRGTARAGEMAVRESIGASRGQLVAQLCAEAGLSAALGGLLALPIAVMTLAAVTPVLPASIADGFTFSVGWQAASFAALVTVVVAIACGVLPALRTARTGTAPALKRHAAQAVGGRGAARLRMGLAAAQIAFSMVLLALAGFFARSLLNVARIDLGIDVDSVATFSVAPELSGYDDAQAALIYDGIERALAGQPGVIGESSAAMRVLAGAYANSDMVVAGIVGDAQPMNSSFNLVGPGYFETLGIPLLAGREFAEADTADGPPIAIVNESFARRYGPAELALGETLTAGPDRYEIVGVVADTANDDIKGEAPVQFFVPLEGNHSFSIPSSLTFYVRAALDPDALLASLPRAVASVDAALPVSNVMSLRRQAQESVFIDRLVTILSAGFAGIATLLAAVGLYGVMAYDTAQRTRELGLRLALGAQPGNLRSMVLKQAGWMALIGIVFGLVAAVGSGRAAEALLYGLSSRDPAVLFASAVVLVNIVLAASYVPARRASRIAPMEALRYE